MKLAWATDIHLDSATKSQRRAFARRIRKSDFDALLVTGDLATSDERALFRDFAALCEKPVYAIMGNHDVWGSNRREAQLAFALMCAPLLNRRLDGAEVTHLHGESVRFGDTLLVGWDGWYDARAGDPHGSKMVLNDWRHVSDYKQMARCDLVEKLQRDGAREADEALALLRSTPQTPRLIFATHVPPFPDSARATGSDLDGLPWYTNVALGRVLCEFADERPVTQITVLSGHVHGASEIAIRPNLVACTGAAEYGMPVVARILDVV